MDMLTDEQVARMLCVMHLLGVELRHLLREGQVGRALRLADELEVIPQYIAARRDESYDVLIDSLHAYQDQYRDSINPDMREYTALLEGTAPIPCTCFVMKWRTVME